MRIICKSAIVWLLAVVLLGACHKENSGDLAELLTTVPSGAGAVVTINLQEIISKAGGKVADGKVQPGEKMAPALEKAASQPELYQFFDETAGVDASAAVAFYASGRWYLTGLLRDPDAFRAWWESKGQTFEASGELQAARKVAYKANRFWWGLTDIDIPSVGDYASLSESRSWASRPNAGNLTSGDHEIAFVLDEKVLFSYAGGDMRSGQLRMALSSAFKDASAFAGSVDLRDGRMTASIVPVNDDMKPAEILLPLGKVSGDVVKKLDCSASKVWAVAVPGKLTEKVCSMISGLGLVPGSVVEAIRPIDGTVAVAVDASDSGMKGIIETNGKTLSPLTDFLATVGIKSVVDGKKMEITKGDVIGKLPVAGYASDFQGAFVAGAVDLTETPGMETPGFKSSVDRMVLVVKPEGKGLKAETSFYSPDPKRNFLLTWLELGLK